MERTQNDSALSITFTGSGRYLFPVSDSHHSLLSTTSEADVFIYNWDISFFYPHEVVAQNGFDQGDFPLWNPYFGGGSPGLSKIQIGLFYPPLVLLRFILPVVARLNWDAVINVFIAGLGIYWLMRDLATSRAAAIFSAVAFMLSGSIIPSVFAEIGRAHVRNPFT